MVFLDGSHRENIIKWSFLVKKVIIIEVCKLIEGIKYWKGCVKVIYIDCDVFVFGKFIVLKLYRIIRGFYKVGICKRNGLKLFFYMLIIIS